MNRQVGLTNSQKSCYSEFTGMNCRPMRLPSKILAVAMVKERTETFTETHKGIKCTIIVTTEHDPVAVAEFERLMAQMAAPKLFRGKGIA